MLNVFTPGLRFVRDGSQKGVKKMNFYVDNRRSFCYNVHVDADVAQ